MGSKYTYAFIGLIALFCSNLKAQQNLAVLYGNVSDVNTAEVLVGAIVKAGNSGTSCDINGGYKFRLAPGKYTVSCSFVGFKTETKTLELKENDSLEMNFALAGATALDEVVVSAGRFEQKLSDVTISMELIKPALLQNKNPTQLDIIMNQVPGVTVADGQASIRGGSGFSYGAGSRVLMLVDDMPMLSADAGVME